NNATMQVAGDLTVGGEALTLQGTGIPAAPTNVPLRWFNVGPSPINVGEDNNKQPVTGRVTGIAVDPSEPNGNVIYISTAGGGAWKTKNGGRTWLPLFDFA